MSGEGEKAQQLEKLRQFYAEHPPAKTEKQLEKLLSQPWASLCGRLREKYGCDPDQMNAADVQAPPPTQEPTSPVPWETETNGTSGINDWQPGNELAHTLPRSTSIAIAKEGSLEKEKSENDWKVRYCELVVDDDEGPRLVYRQKQGKRELGRAMLQGAKLTHGSVGARATLLLVDAGGLEYKFGSTDHSIVTEWVNSLQAAMGRDDGDAVPALAPELDSELQQTSAWALPSQEKPSGPASVSSVASTAVSVLAGEIVQAGNLDKRKDQTWKQRYCELSIDEEDGARLVYRQKPGKRMMGIASLAGAVLSQSAVGERRTFTLVDSSGVEFTFGSADGGAVAEWVTKLRDAIGTAPATSSPDRELENPESKPAPSGPQLELEPEQEQGQEQLVSQQEVADDDFLLLEQQAVAEAESTGGVLSPPPSVPATRPAASRPPPLPARTTQKQRGATASDFMASLVGDDSPRTPQPISGSQTQISSGLPSEGLPPAHAAEQRSKLKLTSVESHPQVTASSADVEMMKQELAELRSSNEELRRIAREADERSQQIAEANASLEQRAVAAETAVSSAERTQAAAVESATAFHAHEADRLRDDVGKLRRELLSRNAQHEEMRSKNAALAAARDAALANEQAAVESYAAERAASQQAVLKEREAGESVAAQLRDRLQEAESRVAAAEAAGVQAAKREKALREESGERSLELDAKSKQVEQLQVERSSLQETLRQEKAENTRLLGLMSGSEKEHNTRIEELLHQVELWEAEANRLNADTIQKDAIVAQMRAEAEQLYNELGALHQSADETQAELSSRARKAEAEVVRLRLQMSQIEDSAEDSVAGHEEESARHLAELRSEISRLLLQESEAKDLAQTNALRVAELERELAAAQSSAATAAESAAAASTEAQEKLSAMVSRAKSAEEVSATRLTELAALEDQVVSLSAQLVSSNKESASSKNALEQRLNVAQRDNGKFVLELSNLRGELAALRTSASSMTTVHAEKDKQIGALSQDVLSLTKQLEDLRQQLDGRDGAHADSAREQAAAFEVRITQVRLVDFYSQSMPLHRGVADCSCGCVQLEAKLDEAQRETASALQVQSQISEDLASTKRELSAATARAVTAEGAAEEAKAQREASIEAERKAKAELQERLDEIEEGTSEMEKLIEENEVRSMHQALSLSRARGHADRQ